MSHHLEMEDVWYFLMSGDSMQEQQRRDVHATLTLSYTEALNGTTRTLTLPSGRQVTVSLPAGTYNGEEIRLENQGEIPSGGGPPGALILSIVVAPVGYSPYPQQGFEDSTEIAAPPPPPPSSSSPNYPAVGSAGAYTNYSPQRPGVDSYLPAYMEPPATAQQRQGLSLAVMTLLVVLVVLLIGAGGLIYYTTVLHPAQIHVQATPTAIAQGTAEVIATATAFQNIYTQTTSGIPVLNDPLSGPDNNHWDENSYCTFTGGAYHVTESQQGTFNTCNAQSTNFFNLTLQVQMVIVKGDFGGILFRSDSTGSNAYIFGIYQDGSYFFTAVLNTNGQSPLYRSTSPVFRTGLNQANLIAAVARGTNFYLYINGQFVANVSDKSFGPGQIGVFAGDRNNPSDVAFSNLKIWQG